jgi:hypothetical protein
LYSALFYAGYIRLSRIADNAAYIATSQSPHLPEVAVFARVPLDKRESGDLDSYSSDDSDCSSLVVTWAFGTCFLYRFDIIVSELEIASRNVIGQSLLPGGGAVNITS